ncbi:GntR family transcriptional regulator [Oricola cellulosilytica]|uniref:GntR family transcriptional regulator n=1 Tax=Oricola cellulosilytica TaxID=1429082 RepID=A0A4R0PFQ6_9HYPH|nr:GntR family transcriptional regulator [Oricola cellulosilytica]TCD15498.1 GntR family transcriptional regulator [Oricola cellulosilytica]
MDFTTLFSESNIRARGAGPLYVRLRRVLDDLISSRKLEQGQALPTERDIAEMSGLSRVTVRRAVDDLVRAGTLVRRHGSGTFVAPSPTRVQQSLSTLTSFSEDMARRGLATRSVWLGRGLFTPSPDEMMSLGLSVEDRVARFERLRFAAEVPLAIERAAIASDVLPDPAAVDQSLYEALERLNARPSKAVQRISAALVEPADAELLQIGRCDAVLKIERISYLSSGRAIELTRSIYRGDAYDFVAELRLGDNPPKSGDTPI